MFVRKFYFILLSLLLASLLVLNVASCYPLPYYTIPPSNAPGDYSVTEISLYQGCIWISTYDYTGIGRSPVAGFRFYQFVGAPQPTTQAWRQNFEDIYGDALAGYGKLTRIPLWLITVLVALVYPLIFLLARTRGEQRKQLGECEHCGYNLRGNLSGRCPECGQPCNNESAPIDK